MHRATTTGPTTTAPAPARDAARRHRARAAGAVVAVVALLTGACTAKPARSGPKPPAAATAKRPAPNGPAERDIVFPVGVEVSFTDTFGAPRAGGRTHQGEDLMAPKMTPLVAAADGTITWLKWTNDGLGGNYLILTDAQGWSYYYIHMNNDTPGTDDGAGHYDQAFADGIRKGQKVKAGEVIGWVGDSGDAETTGSHLHFELHDPSGAALDPFNSLASARLAVRSAGDSAADQPFGALDSVNRDRATATMRVDGWGIDRHDNGPIHVSVYVNGNPVVDADANGARPDLATAVPGRGTRHGYAIVGWAAAPGARVCVVLHSLGGGGNLRLACVTAPA